MICKLILQTIRLFLAELNHKKAPFLTLSAHILHEKYHKLIRKPEKHERNSMHFYRQMAYSCPPIYTKPHESHG